MGMTQSFAQAMKVFIAAALLALGGVELTSGVENQYDKFNRLKDWRAEDLDGQNTPLFLHRHDTWALDLLGNWNQRASTFGSAPPELVEHLTDGRNRIVTIEHEIDGVPQPEPDIRYDPAGNLIFDGQSVFQYDAWNRLIQVNRGTSFGPPSQPSPENWANITLGPLVKHYTYDAVGRLVRTQAPHPDVGSPVVRSERFYYDGIRRIQELAIDPLLTPIGIEGDPEMEAMLASCMGTCHATP
jgi:hypothetical protein